MEMNLGLKNTILTHNKSREPPATHKRGSQMIDVILSSPEIVITGAAMLGAIHQPTTLPGLVRENGPTRQNQNGTNAGSRKEVP
jgi:hypothetical protein